jgi:hypothetical protein
MATNLYVAGENIDAGCPVAISPRDGKVYSTRTHVADRPFPIATENLREGFRVAVTEGDVREDDA